MALEDYPYSFNPLLAVDRVTLAVAKGATITLRADPVGPALAVSDLDGTPLGTTLTTTPDGVIPGHRTTVAQPYIDAGAGIMLRETATELANALTTATEARDAAERAVEAAEQMLANRREINGIPTLWVYHRVGESPIPADLPPGTLVVRTG